MLARLNSAADGIPRCDTGHPLKPDVVLFGDLLPAAATERAWELAARADLLLCVGSSLQVHPVAQLPGVTLESGGKLAIVTRGATPFDFRAAIRLDGDVAEELSDMVAELPAQA